MTINKDTLLQGLFGSNDNNAEDRESKSIIKNIPLGSIRDLYSFEHPFDKSFRSNVGIDELAEQIKVSGVLEPIIVRSQCDGLAYECLAGHRRRKAAAIAGLSEIPAIIKECSDDEAKIIVTDTNLGQREDLFPSEKAKAYKIQLEALKNQGKRNDLIANVENADESDYERSSEKKTAREIVGELNGVSAREISRYVKLNNLIPELLDIIDDKLDKRLNVSSGLELSRLSKESQSRIYKIIIEQNLTISIKIAEKVSEALLEEYNFSDQELYELLSSGNSDKNRNILKTFNRARNMLSKKLLESEYNITSKAVNEDELMDVIVNAAINYLCDTELEE